MICKLINVGRLIDSKASARLNKKTLCSGNCEKKRDGDSWSAPICLFFIFLEREEEVAEGEGESFFLNFVHLF